MSEQQTYSQQIEQLSPKKGDLLVVSVPFPLNTWQGRLIGSSVS